jgi:hypothetical protein
MSWWVQVQGEDYANQFFSIDMLHQLDQYEVDILAPNCKTRACVAGWTATLWAGELSQAEWITMGFERAGTALLGLDEETQTWLFDAEAQHQTAEQAAEVLRELARYTQVTGGSDGFVEYWSGEDDG